MKTLSQWFKAWSPNCRAATRAYSRSLDSQLPFNARAGLWLHLLICKWCRRYTRQTRFLRTVCQHADHQREQAALRYPLSPECRSHIKARLELELKQN